MYVLIDVDKSTETLGYLYQAASIKLENIYELGAFAVIVFLLILCVLPIGSKKILLNERPIFNNLSWGAMMFVAGMGASILWASPVEWAQTINSNLLVLIFPHQKLLNTAKLILYFIGVL